jgi:1-aminocyclopropane-1-carboxylate synthase
LLFAILSSDTNVWWFFIFVDLQAFANVNYFSLVSNDTQETLANLFTDVSWCKTFIADNQSMLLRLYSNVTALLSEAGIPFVAATAGMFVWVDLREFLDEPGTWEAEERLTAHLFDSLKILLTPGHACHAIAPGYYRCCFAWMPAEATMTGVSRLCKWAERYRRLKAKNAAV